MAFERHERRRGGIISMPFFHVSFLRRCLKNKTKESHSKQENRIQFTYIHNRDNKAGTKTPRKGGSLRTKLKKTILKITELARSKFRRLLSVLACRLTAKLEAVSYTYGSE